jgi:aspartyl-tRNA(Asn)/glutamyl-tRNA(Gln) amidotransferase subunit A
MRTGSTTELTRLSAAEALRRFHRRDVSPVEVMEAIITVAETTEPHVHAFSETFFEQALEAAREAEARYAGKGAPPRALEGLAIGIKEVTPVEGQRTTHGSLAYREAPLEKESAPLVARILQAGGIIHARTTSPEFTCVPFTHSRLWGVTRNPWNLEFSPGGSSGGAAVALALGTATLANGTDIGGSIRMPAAFCGVVGLKPSYGRVPATAPWNLDHYSHEGPIARTVGDCALLENVIAGPHSADPASIRPEVPIPDGLGDVAGAQIALSVDLDGYLVDRDVARNTLDTADALREAGAKVEEVQIGWELAEIIEAARVHYGLIFAAYVQREVDAHPDLLSDYATAFANRGASISSADVLDGLEKEAKIFTALATVLERYDTLICPTLSVHGYAAGDSYLDHGPTVNGREVPNILETMMTVPFNICSRCPVLNVPSGTAASGVPTGVQIVGRPYDDVSVFEIGAALERVRPWDQLQPDVSFAQ